jgi:hypothetical protein
MPKITRISEQQSNTERLSIYIDGEFCTGIRKRTFKGMKLKEGYEISCMELKEKENFFWKHSYAEEAWVKEKVRLDRIKELLENSDDRIDIRIVGFGADSTEIIKEHPDEKGVPDLNVYIKNTDSIIMLIEVTGTETMRGSDYWVRPDKLQYAENHPDENVWTALHYSEPNELIRFLKHIPGKKYKQVTRPIRGADEIYCSFEDHDDEILTLEKFKVEFKKAIDSSVNKE